MEHLQDLLDQLVCEAESHAVYAYRQLHEHAVVVEQDVLAVRQAIIDHVTSLVEAARKEGENG